MVGCSATLRPFWNGLGRDGGDDGSGGGWIRFRWMTDLLCSLVNEKRVALRPQRVGYKSTDTGQELPSLPQDGQPLDGQQAAAWRVVIRERHVHPAPAQRGRPGSWAASSSAPWASASFARGPSASRSSRSADATPSWSEFLPVFRIVTDSVRAAGQVVIRHLGRQLPRPPPFRAQLAGVCAKA